jgi:acetyl esterase/lipase
MPSQHAARRALATILFSLLFFTGAAFAAAPTEPVPLWPGVAPGDKGELSPEADQTKPGQDGNDPKKYIMRLGNVSKPTLTIRRPPADKETGAAMVVCPGGGYSILAMDLEGTEVCDWLNSVGVTGLLLKYRVPTRPGDDTHVAPLQDAQRALSLARLHAADWGIDAKRIGILGFSAGGHLCARASTAFEPRAYEPIDDADKQSCRPDFSVLIYPAYLADSKDTSKMAGDLKVTPATPPAFLVMTQDDPVNVDNAVAYFVALRQAKVSAELHVFPTGGHGYGLRPSPQPVSTWPSLAAAWLKAQGWLNRK